MWRTTLTLIPPREGEEAIFRRGSVWRGRKYKLWISVDCFSRFVFYRVTSITGFRNARPTHRGCQN